MAEVAQNLHPVLPKQEFQGTLKNSVPSVYFNYFCNVVKICRRCPHKSIHRLNRWTVSNGNDCT